MTDFPVTVFHNPACGTSRRVLEIIESAGVQATVVEYIKTGWTKDGLAELLRHAGLAPRDVLRGRGSPAEELGLLDPETDDGLLLAAMVEHPILVNRPIVRTPNGAALCRPAERVLELIGGSFEAASRSPS